MTEANKKLLIEIRKLKELHPNWGYRRVWAYLRHRMNLPVNHKRVYRLMKLHDLLVPKNRKLKAKRQSTTSKPRSFEPNRLWGMDMTKILIPSYGWAYLHITLDWGSKKIVGVNLRKSSKTQDWFDCLSQAVNDQFPKGIREQKQVLQLVTDNGCQPTSKLFQIKCRTLQIQQIFTSYCNPKGNADTERVIRTIKEDLVWTNEWESFEQLEKAILQWVKDYNEDFPHMALAYMTPYQYEQWYIAATA